MCEQRNFENAEKMSDVKPENGDGGGGGGESTTTSSTTTTTTTVTTTSVLDDLTGADSPQIQTGTKFIYWCILPPIFMI